MGPPERIAGRVRAVICVRATGGCGAVAWEVARRSFSSEAGFFFRASSHAFSVCSCAGDCNENALVWTSSAAGDLAVVNGGDLTAGCDALGNRSVTPA